MIQRRILYHGHDLILACDGKCNKAWGHNGRPRHRFQPEDVDPDDHVAFADSDLGRAPGPGKTAIVCEGGHAKPSTSSLKDGERMNKWCARECERSTKVPVGDVIVLPDLEYPKPNLFSRRIPG